jgi:hypothetical protein
MNRPAISQTVIKLTLGRGPWKNHQWERHRFVNAGDTAFLSVGAGVLLDEPYYDLRDGIPDGKYSVFVNDTLSLTAFINHQLRDSVWTYYRDGQLWFKRAYSKGNWINDDYGDYFHRHLSFFYIPSSDSTATKVYYQLDPKALVIGITKYAIEHPVLLKKFLKQKGLTYNNEDYDKIIHPFRTKSSSLRVYKKYNSKFETTNCKELEALRSDNQFIRTAGPRILDLIDYKPTGTRFLFFTNYITVYIDSINEPEFEKLAMQEKAIISYKGKANDKTKTIYQLKYDNSVGTDISEIAKKLLNNKIIFGSYPCFENLEPINSGQARF